MTNTCQITVIIPVYNGAQYLTEAIESVIAQTYAADEVIIIDDGSTDGSADIVKRFSPTVHYHWQPNGGAGAARNRGVSLAHGAFLAFLDADDLWLRDKLARQVAALESDRSLDMVFGQVQQFYSPELDEATRRGIRIPVETSAGAIPSAMLVKREAFLRVGPFRTDVQLGEFIDWHSRAMEGGLKSISLPEVVTKRRIHLTNLGTRQRDSRGDYLRVLKSAIDRRKNLGKN